jgi:hypothetical protein
MEFRKTRSSFSFLPVFSLALILIIPILLCLRAPVLEAQSTITETLIAAGDNYLLVNDKDKNKGSQDILKISEVSRSRVLVIFDQADILSALNGRPLVSASLELYVDQNWGSWTASGRRVDVYAITTSWTEMGSTWNCPNDTNLSNSQPDCPVQWSGGAYASTSTDHKQFYDSTIGWKSFDVTADVTSFVGGANNYGWLIKKDQATDSGDADFKSRESSNETKRPRLVLTIDNSNTLPSVTAVPSPLPNSAGWNNTDVPVSCVCSDPDSADYITYCTPNQLITTEGAAQTVTCIARDSRGGESSTGITLNIDKTTPSAQITSPLDGTILASTQVTLNGSSLDALSGVQTVICNGIEADLYGGSYTCESGLNEGANSIVVEAYDAAGNIGAAGISVTSETGQSPLIIDSVDPPIVPADGIEQLIYVDGEGYNENTHVFVDGQEVSLLLVDWNHIIFGVIFSTTSLHSLEIINGVSDPYISTVWEPGFMAIKPGEILLVPGAAAPQGSDSFSVFGNYESIETGATIHVATSGSGCYFGVTPMQSSTYVNDHELGAVTPALSVGSYDVFVDNPTQPDLCLANGISIANPPLVVEPSVAEPEGGNPISLLGSLGNFQPGVNVYLAPSGSGCSSNLTPMQSLSYLSDSELAATTPGLALG